MGSFRSNQQRFQGSYGLFFWFHRAFQMFVEITTDVITRLNRWVLFHVIISRLNRFAFLWGYLWTAQTIISHLWCQDENKFLPDADYNIAREKQVQALRRGGWRSQNFCWFLLIEGTLVNICCKKTWLSHCWTWWNVLQPGFFRGSTCFFFRKEPSETTEALFGPFAADQRC